MLILRNRNKRNKKVLLRERKRHTARRVASARYADLSPDNGPILLTRGLPHPVLDRRYSHPVSMGVPWGTPHPDLRWGTPQSAGWGTPHPGLRWGPPVQTWDGVSPCPDLGWGTPYPPCQPDEVPPSAGWGTTPS